MKAKYYFDLYHEEIWKEYQSVIATEEWQNATPESRQLLMKARMSAAHRLYTEMRREIVILMDKRQVQTDRGAMAVIREVNDRWNAVVNMFVKRYKISPLIRDGLLKAVAREFRLYRENQMSAEEEANHE